MTKPEIPAPIEGEDVLTLVGSLADALAGACNQTDGRPVLVAGIAHGGVSLSRFLAQLLERRLGHPVTLGTIDVAFHRDDIGRRPIPAPSPDSATDFDTEGAIVLLVDDVIQSGRTVRAALNEVFDHGRPERVWLAALIDRGGRQLPFQADFIGKKMDLADDLDIAVELNETDASKHVIRFLQR